MGRRSRQRQKASGLTVATEPVSAPASDYADADGNLLTLRGSLTPAARSEYASVLQGGLNQEDAWQRATELLFERLAVSWTIAGLQTSKQKELLARYRVASEQERRFVRDSLRAHVTENFPELQAP